MHDLERMSQHRRLHLWPGRMGTQVQHPSAYETPHNNQRHHTRSGNNYCRPSPLVCLDSRRMRHGIQCASTHVRNIVHGSWESCDRCYVSWFVCFFLRSLGSNTSDWSPCDHWYRTVTYLISRQQNAKTNMKIQQVDVKRQPLWNSLAALSWIWLPRMQVQL